MCADTANFVDYNKIYYHETLGNVVLMYLYFGRLEAISEKR